MGDVHEPLAYSNSEPLSPQTIHYWTEVPNTMYNASIIPPETTESQLLYNMGPYAGEFTRDQLFYDVDSYTGEFTMEQSFYI